MNTLIARIMILSVVFVFAGVNVQDVSADHSWGTYHWARTANPFTLQLGDNVTSAWDAYLEVASVDWSKSSVLDTVIVAGSGSRNCKAVKGRVEVCNGKYGNNGWLGIAQISVSGSHITQGVVKMNDTYFNTSTYNTSAWRQMVVCQEIGHTFGLDHQDENFTNPNLGTCMDYTGDPSTNQHPNQHDYDQLETIYSHVDTAVSSDKPPRGKGNGKGNGNIDIDTISRAEWGKETRTLENGRSSQFERDFGNGEKLFTFVIWAD